MTTEQAAELLTLLQQHLSWEGLIGGFILGLVFGLGLAIYHGAKKSMDEIE